MFYLYLQSSSADSVHQSNIKPCPTLMVFELFDSQSDYLNYYSKDSNWLIVACSMRVWSILRLRLMFLPTLPACFTTEQGTVKASRLVRY